MGLFRKKERVVVKKETKEDNTPKHIKQRELFFNKEVNAKNVESIIEAIRDINAYDDEQEKKDKKYVRKPINLTVDSFGGSIYCGNALVALIDSSRTPVHTYCYGKAMSMGLYIFSAGHKRYAHPLARFMYHEGSTVIGGFAQEIIERAEELKTLVDANDKLLIKNTKLTEKKLKKVRESRRDWYFFAEEAKKHGVVHELIESTRG